MELAEFTLIYIGEYLSELTPIATLTIIKGVLVIPCDSNALIERLDLLLASKEAGHTDVGNQLVSICDEIKRQGVLDSNSYKNLISTIKMIVSRHRF